MRMSEIRNNEKPATLATPERALWFAVLERALRDVDVHDTYNSNYWPGRGLTIEEVVAATTEWIISSRDEPGSCKWVCEAVGVNHARYKAMAEKKLDERYKRTRAVIGADRNGISDTYQDQDSEEGDFSELL